MSSVKLFDFEDEEDALRYATENSAQLGTTLTLFPSLLSSFTPDYNRYDKMARSGNPKEVSKAAALLLEDNLRAAAPIVTQLMFLSSTIVRPIYSDMRRNADIVALAQIYDKYLGKGAKCEDKREIDLYNRALTGFRRLIPSFEASPVMTGAVQTELKVGAYVSEIKEMLSKMILGREEQLGAGGKGAAHFDDVITTLENADLSEELLFSFKDGAKAMRKATVTDQNGVEVQLYLVSTALAKLRQLDQRKFEVLEDKISKMSSRGEIAKDNKEFLMVCLNQAKLLVTNEYTSDSGEAFEQQKSNIDPVFLAFFIPIMILGVSYEDFPRYQRGIYTLTKVIRGKVNMKRAINTLTRLPGMRTLESKLSESADIHLPPWVLNSSRIYDMGAVIGGVDLAAPKVLNYPAISWRYFLGLNYHLNTDCFKFLYTLWEIEGRGEQPDIRLAERALQQLILGRPSPLANTNQVTGNALNVRIIS